MCILKCVLCENFDFIEAINFFEIWLCEESREYLRLLLDIVESQNLA